MVEPSSLRIAYLGPKGSFTHQASPSFIEFLCIKRCTVRREMGVEELGICVGVRIDAVTIDEGLYQE